MGAYPQSGQLGGQVINMNPAILPGVAGAGAPPSNASPLDDFLRRNWKLIILILASVFIVYLWIQRKRNSSNQSLVASGLTYNDREYIRVPNPTRVSLSSLQNPFLQGPQATPDPVFDPYNSSPADSSPEIVYEPKYITSQSNQSLSVKQRPAPVLVSKQGGNIPVPTSVTQANPNQNGMAAHDSTIHPYDMGQQTSSFGSYPF